jgi:thiamine pyrophosphate-dependent acetolactate synthase large subunit-like protein
MPTYAARDIKIRRGMMATLSGNLATMGPGVPYAIAAKFAWPDQDVPDFHFARYAEMLGLTGLRVDQPEQIGPAWDEALAANRPVVIEAVTDPEVPPLPPHITLKEAMNSVNRCCLTLPAKA